MIKVTVLESISQLTILDSITLYGSTAGAIPASLEHIRQVIASVQYPLPEGIEVIILPFIIDRIDDMFVPADGVAAYATRKIYLSAFHRFDFSTPAHMRLGWARTTLHELGHMVHYAHLPAPAFGVPTGLWDVFQQVGGMRIANRTYDSSLAEAFAEWWRLLFSPLTQTLPHRQNLTFRIGIKEWMLSLTGALALAINHNRAYQRGFAFVLENTPIIHRGRTFVPLRFVSEAVGKRVEWRDPHTIIVWE
ncbi:MAG: hypothetical protein DDT19_01352 [Syntrophomonadaceae bacterium]|nr:hypothetical protein [Bacillota bacterium]